MASGVAVDERCVKEFNDLKLKHCYRYIIYKLTENLKSIEIQTLAPKESTYDDFCEELLAAAAAGEGRYAVFDFEYKDKNNAQKEKLVFLNWCRDDIKLKQRMLYASSKDAIRKKLVGIAAEIQVNDNDDLDEAEILKKLEAFK